MPQTFTVGSRSLFVRLTALVFIIVAALASASALVQNAAIGAVVEPWRGATLPFVTGLLVAYLPWVVGAAGVVSVTLLVCAVGLLMRLEWARRAAIVLLVMAIVANLAGMWLQHEVVHALVEATLLKSPLPPLALGVFGGVATAAQVMAMLMTLAACLVFWWLIQRLRSDVVRQEFACAGAKPTPSHASRPRAGQAFSSPST